MSKKKSIGIMLLGIVLVLIGIAIAQPIVAGYLFRTFLFIPFWFVDYKSNISIVVILAGAIIAFIGFNRSKRN